MHPASRCTSLEAGVGGTILLVEDNPAQVQMTQRVLRECGRNLALVVVRDGQAAVDYLFHQGDYTADPTWRLPNLVLLDLNLPHLNGREVLERLRASPSHRHLPVIVLSSSCQEPEVRELYAAGANSYVEKPQEYTRFCEMMHNLLRFWLDTSLLPRGEA